VAIAIMLKRSLATRDGAALPHARAA
jgi:hypothetical protein